VGTQSQVLKKTAADENAENEEGENPARRRDRGGFSRGEESETLFVESIEDIEDEGSSKPSFPG
jgi:hypothetical protein